VDQLARDDLDLAGGHVGVGLVAGNNLALDLHRVLERDVLGRLAGGLGAALVDGDLHEAVAVAEHDEHDAAAVAHVLRPALDDDLGTSVLRAQLAAGVGATLEHVGDSQKEVRA
jgi:hypothetical protein